MRCVDTEPALRQQAERQRLVLLALDKVVYDAEVTTALLGEHNTGRTVKVLDRHRRVDSSPSLVGHVPLEGAHPLLSNETTVDELDGAVTRDDEQRTHS